MALNLGRIMLGANRLRNILLTETDFVRKLTNVHADQRLGRTSFIVWLSRSNRVNDGGDAQQPNDRKGNAYGHFLCP